MVLRYLNVKKTQNQHKSYGTFIEKCLEAYDQKKYDKCIRFGKHLLENPTYGGYNPQLYEYIGLSYSYLQNPEEATKYLTIAESLKEELENKKTERLQQNPDNKNSFTNPESKIYVEIKESEFADDLDDNYGISDIEEIAYYIQTEKISIEVACQRYAFTDEQIQLVKLIYAKDYYIESMYPQGDKLLQEVEKSKNKTKRVRDLLNEIRANKKFYKNRPNVHSRKRILK